MGFCPSGVLSHWGFVPVVFCPVGFCPSGVLSQWGFVLHSHLLYTHCLIAVEIKTIGGGIRVPWTLFLVSLHLHINLNFEDQVKIAKLMSHSSVFISRL